MCAGDRRANGIVDASVQQRNRREALDVDLAVLDPHVFFAPDLVIEAVNHLRGPFGQCTVPLRGRLDGRFIAVTPGRDGASAMALLEPSRYEAWRYHGCRRIVAAKSLGVQEGGVPVRRRPL